MKIIKDGNNMLVEIKTWNKMMIEYGIRLMCINLSPSFNPAMENNLPKDRIIEVMPHNEIYLWKGMQISNFMIEKIVSFNSTKGENMIKLTLETAKKLYQEGGAGKAFALDNYNAKELAPLPSSWKELGNIDGAFVNSYSMIETSMNIDTITTNENIFATLPQAQASIALAQLSQLMAVYNGGWTPDWKTANNKYTIIITETEITTETYHYSQRFLTFKTKQIRSLFLDNFHDLINQAKPLL